MKVLNVLGGKKGRKINASTACVLAHQLVWVTHTQPHGKQFHVRNVLFDSPLTLASLVAIGRAVARGLE